MIPRVVAGTRPSASQQNKIVDQLNRLTTGTGEAFGSDQAGQKVFVLNRTGMDLEVGMAAPFKPGAANPYPGSPLRQISGTVGELYDPSDWETEDTDGDDPPWNNWVVAAQRIPSGQSGWAYCSGIVMARVRNEEAGSASIEYQYADLVTWEEGGAGSGGTAWFHLNRMPSGSARILWVDDAYGSGGAGGAGEVWQWAMIRFEGTSAQPVLYNVITDDATILSGKRLLADGTEATAEEYFSPNPEGRLALIVKTAEGRATLFKGGVKYICQLKAGEATSPINAVFEIESYDESTETHTVIRPTADSMPDASLVIGPARAIEAEGIFTVPMEGERWGKIQASVSVKDDVGSTADQYYLTKDNTGYKVLGYNATEGRALVRPFSSPGGTAASWEFNTTSSAHVAAIPTRDVWAELYGYDIAEEDRFTLAESGSIHIRTSNTTATVPVYLSPTLNSSANNITIRYTMGFRIVLQSAGPITVAATNYGLCAEVSGKGTPLTVLTLAPGASPYSGGSAAVSVIMSGNFTGSSEPITRISFQYIYSPGSINYMDYYDWAVNPIKIIYAPFTI